MITAVVPIAEFDEELQTKCDEFATKRVITSGGYYRMVRGSKMEPSALKGSFYYAALAEFAVGKVMEQLGLKVQVEPDLEMYNKRRKSFKCDLEVVDSAGVTWRLHVKSQMAHQGKKYGKSWLFEAGDKVLSGESTQDLLVFCTTDSDKVIVEAVFPARHALKVAKKPKLGYLKTKAAIYLEDLPTNLMVTASDGSLEA